MVMAQGIHINKSMKGLTAAAAAVASGERPGLQVAVFKDGNAVLVKSYGSANLEQRVAVSNDSIFRVGSVTKQFTAVALLLLVEKGKVSLQDKLSKYYPNFPRADDDHATVVVLSNAIGKDVGVTKIADRIERLAIGLPAKP